MSRIKQLLQLYQSGFSNHCIGRELQLDKETVNSYIRKVQSNGFDIAYLLSLDDPVLEKKFSAGNPAYTEERFQVIKDKLSYFESELGRKHVTRRIIWEEYKKEYPDGYSYSQFCYHLSQMSLARHPTAILDHVAGGEMHVDFAGDTLSYVDRETGETIKVQVLVACLPYSDYTFAIAVGSQTTVDFLYALSCALQYFGGSPKILVTDNLKSAVIKTDRYEPELNRNDCQNLP